MEMICNNCGAEINHVLIDEFQYDGTDRDRLAVLEDLGDKFKAHIEFEIDYIDGE